VSARITIEDADSSAGFNLLAPNRTWYFVADNSPDGFSISSTGGANFFISNAGKVGLGTTSPYSLLEVTKAGTVTTTNTYDPTNPLLTFRNTSATNNNYSGIGFANSATSGFLTSAIFGVNETHTTTPSGHLEFFTKNAGTFSEAMRISATGNVGIGTSAPTEKLHVTGNVKVTGNIDVSGTINAKYQDVAEWVDSSQHLAAGSVVVLDITKTNQVIASTQSYDSRVAGVISLRPGVALGERGEGRVLVATTGRVKVKVDATNGPIQIGDLLVTSEKAGIAMKSVPVEIGGVRIHRPGTLIGKALEPLKNGTGEILVY